MKTAVFLAASAAVLAMATPLNVEKRKIETDIVIEWKTVYVTEGESATVLADPLHHHAYTPTTSPTPTTSSTPTAAPAETETEAPVSEPPVSTTTAAPEPAVEPASSEASAAEAPSSSTAQDASPSPTDYASTAVYQHNIHRVNYSAPAIGWSDTYAGYAAQTAAKCVFAHDLTPGGGGYGQNLALWGSSGNVADKSESDTVAQAITDMWHNGECEAYPKADYGQPNPDMSNFEAWGHFSQLVWVGSEQVGCASQYCPPGTIYSDMGSWFTVCDYYPAGNMGGEYGTNVLPSLNEATVVV